MVDVVASPVKQWVVDLPTGFDAVVVHVFPKANRERRERRREREGERERQREIYMKSIFVIFGYGST